jgi:hypothetical protein
MLLQARLRRPIQPRVFSFEKSVFIQTSDLSEVPRPPARTDVEKKISNSDSKRREPGTIGPISSAIEDPQCQPPRGKDSEVKPFRAM